MDPHVRAFGEAFANAALARDWPGVRAMLAPWLQRSLSPDHVRAFFEDDYAATLAESGIAEPHFPEVPYVSGNSCTLADLLTPSFGAPPPIPSEVTAENFRQWMKVQLQCFDEQAASLDFDYFTEVWLIVVAHQEGLKIGYWVHDPNAYIPPAAGQ
jgi:hypothetical protein